MCGIVGYVGELSAVDILIMALKRLEYRGYDSVGISVFKNTQIDTIKGKGQISDLLRQHDLSQYRAATIGIGHTRWATHGKPSDRNAHPHTTESLSLVHNGIIENYIDLKRELIRSGYHFVSTTDSEVAAKQLDLRYRKTQDPVPALCRLDKDLQGSYALAVLFKDHPDTLYALRRSSPLLIGINDHGHILASDISALLDFTRNYVELAEGQIAVITKDRLMIYNADGVSVDYQVRTSELDITNIDKGIYPHFMLKEISEQPQAVAATLSGIKNQLTKPDNFFRQFRQIYLTGCGTALNAGMLAVGYFKELLHISATASIASEFRYDPPCFGSDELLIVISQSGETADTLAALHLAQAQGVPVLAIVNVRDSSIARAADQVLYTAAGMEVSVASTKAFTTQVALVAYMISSAITIETKRQSCLSELTDLPRLISKTLELKSEAVAVAKLIAQDDHLFFIGRLRDAALLQEASLKLKEISYIHSEAYPAGELKHGTLALIEDQTKVIALVTQTRITAKMISNIEEVKARGAIVILVKKRSVEIPADLVNYTIELPDGPDWLMPMVAIPFLQLLAYYTALERGCAVDRPRNLAKSVTVE